MTVTRRFALHSRSELFTYARLQNEKQLLIHELRISEVTSRNGRQRRKIVLDIDDITFFSLGLFRNGDEQLHLIGHDKSSPIAQQTFWIDLEHDYPDHFIQLTCSSENEEMMHHVAHYVHTNSQRLDVFLGAHHE